jgi:hypothetical protein
VVTLCSSDTDEALELLSLSPAHDLSSQILGVDAPKPSSSTESDLFKDWPEANNMTVSVYIVLTTETLSSRASVANAPHDRQKSRAGSFTTRQTRSRMTPLKRFHWWENKSVDALRRRSKTTKKVAAEDASMAPLLIYITKMSATEFRR